jgi:parallel beta-helix repeat protein
MSLRNARCFLDAALFCITLTAASHNFAGAKTLCVQPSPPAGCFATIGAAVTAAAASDQINIGPGQYNEGVIVNKPLTLAGAGSDATIINAKGLPNGIYVDGLDNPGLSYVKITGVTVMNANYEGILVTSASNILIANNHVAANDQSLNYAAATCAGEPSFETNEGEDCGEGIHLVGVSFSTVANNNVELNSGGILLSDETGITYLNQITGNSVHDNALDCGITLASHAPSPQASSKLPYGVLDNTVSSNTVTGNGRVGAGAGIGVFAPGPGNMAYGNQIIGNVIMNNGLPGVTVHNHAAPAGAPGINLNSIAIIGNYISGNQADTEDAATPGTAGINIFGVAGIWQTVILENTIENEQFDVVMNNPGAMDVHQNNLLGTGTGVANLGVGALDASSNFFGCAGGPGATGCSTVSGSGVVSSPWLTTGVPVVTSPQGQP